MLRKPHRSRTGRVRSNGEANGGGGSSRAITRAKSRSRTRADIAPLATPEDDGKRTFDLGIQIGKKLGKSIGRFERRHSLGREKPRYRSTAISKEHHSATEFTDTETSQEI
ncbi:hypothetical protein V3C99_018887 [Haemonchus contortus]|nr:unnamed protein product [Haemonchus contortus]